MKTILALLLSAIALSAQSILWRFQEDPVQTCPSSMGFPLIEDPQGIQFNPQYSVGGSVSITWWQFDPNAPVMLWLSTDQSRSFFPPCVLVPPDFMLTGTTMADGRVRFMWPVPVTAPLSVVPLGTNTLGVAQVVEIATVPPTVTSYVVNIASIR